MVITFANQKGGVGKSTLAMLFANWLTERNESVVIIDLDRQSTIHPVSYTHLDVYKRQTPPSPAL